MQIVKWLTPTTDLYLEINNSSATQNMASISQNSETHYAVSKRESLHI